MAETPDAGDRNTADRAELIALRHENAILRQTLDAIDGTVVVYDAERRFVLANRAYHDFFPHLPADQELIGQRYEDVLTHSIEAHSVADPQAYTDRAAFLERRIRALNRRDATPREIHDLETDHWYMVRVRHTEDGHRVALRVDITQQKQLQRELEQARAAAERASAGKSRFLANISHELRTPLNAVINFARLLTEQIHGPLGAPAYLDYAQSIRESGTHLLALIEELLDFARAESGRLTLNEQPVNLRALIGSVVRLLQPEAAKTQITLHLTAPADLPPVQGDNTRLRQVLFNLLHNAITYTGPGGRVDVSASRLADGGLEIRIADNGPGIAAADLSRVLLPFERAVDGGYAHHPGMGLGLALTNHLVALHGGELRLSSTVGHGTVAVVELPAKRVLAPG